MTRTNAIDLITAAAQGWQNIYVETANGYEFDLLVDPTADLDGEFMGLCTDTGEAFTFYGWNLTIHCEDEALA